MDKQREKGKHPSVHAQNAYDSQVWAMLKPEATNLILVFYVGDMNLNIWLPRLLRSRVHIIRKLEAGAHMELEPWHLFQPASYS